MPTAAAAAGGCLTASSATAGGGGGANAPGCRNGSSRASGCGCVSCASGVGAGLLRSACLAGLLGSACLAGFEDVDLLNASLFGVVDDESNPKSCSQFSTFSTGGSCFPVGLPITANRLTGGPTSCTLLSLPAALSHACPRYSRLRRCSLSSSVSLALMLMQLKELVVLRSAASPSALGGSKSTSASGISIPSPRRC